MSYNRLNRYAHFIEIKYKLGSINIDEIRADLINFRKVWLRGDAKQGQKKPDQSILHLSEVGTGVEFDKINELIKIVDELGETPELFHETALYSRVSRALNISQALKDSILEAITAARIRSMKNRRKTDINDINRQESNVRTFLRRLDGVYEKAQDKLAKIVKDKSKEDIDEEQLKKLDTGERVGGYEDQKRAPLTEQQMWMFVKGHPDAIKYGLNDQYIFGKIYQDPDLREELTTIVYAANRAKTPKEIQAVTQRIRELTELFKLKNTNEYALERGLDTIQQQTLREDRKRHNDQVFEKNKNLERDPEFMAQQLSNEMDRTRIEWQNKIYKEQEEKEQEEKEEELRKKYQEQQEVLRKFLEEQHELQSLNSNDRKLINNWMRKRGIK